MFLEGPKTVLGDTWVVSKGGHRGLADGERVLVLHLCHFDPQHGVGPHLTIDKVRLQPCIQWRDYLGISKVPVEHGGGVALDKARQGESGAWTTYNLLPLHPGLVLDQVQDMWKLFETGKTQLIHKVWLRKEWLGSFTLLSEGIELRESLLREPVLPPHCWPEQRFWYPIILEQLGRSFQKTLRPDRCRRQHGLSWPRRCWGRRSVSRSATRSVEEIRPGRDYE